MTLSYQNIMPLQLKMTRCGDVNLGANWGRDPAYIPQSRFYYILEGSGFIQTETKTITLEPGNMYLIPSHFHHTYGCTKLRKLYFMFSLLSTTNTDALSGLNKVYHAPFDPEDMEKLLDTWQKRDCFSVMTVRSLLMKHICLLLQTNDVPPIPLNRHSPLVENALSYIRANASSSMTIGSVSKHLFISESKLRNVFLKETGVTVGQYIDKQVCEQAKQLLSRTQLSIGEISARLGFCDQFYFSRKFKQATTMTPSEYRKTYAK